MDDHRSYIDNSEYTSFYDNGIPRAASQHSLSTAATINESHFDDLRTAAKVGKMLLDRSRKLESDLENLERTNQELELELSKSQHDNSWLKEIISNKNSYNSELEEANSTLETMLSKQKTSLFKAENLIKKLNQELLSRNEKIQDLEKKLKNKRRLSNDIDQTKILHPNFILTRTRFDSTCSDSDVQVRSSRSLSHDHLEKAHERDMIEILDKQYFNDLSEKQQVINSLRVQLNEVRSELIAEKSAERIISKPHDLEKTLVEEFQKIEIDQKDSEQKSFAYDKLVSRFEKVLDSIEEEKVKMPLSSRSCMSFQSEDAKESSTSESLGEIKEFQNKVDENNNAVSMSSSMSLHGRLEQEEPEYKRLFQEIFDLIHTVVPVNKS